MLPIFVLVILSSSSYAQDRSCGTNLANLWLDVVYVIDNSAPMTNGGLVRAAAQIISVFGANTRIGSGYSDPRSTRVGIVTYNRNATIAADLNRFTSYNDLVSNIYGVVGDVSQENIAVLESGLTAAKQVLDAGRANNVRANYQPVIVIYASQFVLDNDVVKVSDILKNSGITIITIPFGRNVNLTMISSRNDDIEAGGYGSVTEIQNRLLQINCFCSSSTYHQFHGSCVHANSVASAWTAARLACRATQGYLANELTQAKHDFLFSLVQNSTNFATPYSYFIGLSSNSNGTWTWEGSGNSLSAPTFWNGGSSPSDISGTLVVYNYETSNSTVAWQITGPSTTSMGYICETNACDTDNYCA